jgi:two-component system, NtrC family, C4-dicarboxylate transport sensor histidine kinase DctB
MHVRSAWDRWASRQDAINLDVLGRLGSWLSATALVLAIVAVGAWIPATAEHLQLEARSALLAFGLPAIGGFGLALFHERGEPYSRFEMLSVLWTLTTLQLFCAVLIARSSMMGSVVFFPTLLFTAATHGFVFRSTMSEPFPTMGTVVATIGGAMMCRSLEQVLLLGLAGFLAAVTSLLLGTLAMRAEEGHQRRERLRAAIAAQQLAEQMARIRVLSESIVDMMGTAHDMANALSLVRLSSDLLATLRDAVPKDRHVVVDQIDRALATSTKRIDQMLAEIRERRTATGTAGSMRAVTVQISPVVRRIADSVRQRFSNVSMKLDLEEDACVMLVGGIATLERIAENLLLNAVQGDGTRAARTVTVRASAEARAEAYELCFEDDGPGFAESILTRPPTAFSSTKPSGTGLGLYTIERLVTASGGTLQLENRQEGGARVVVQLPKGTR